MDVKFRLNRCMRGKNCRNTAIFTTFWKYITYHSQQLQVFHVLISRAWYASVSAQKTIRYAYTLCLGGSVRGIRNCRSVLQRSAHSSWQNGIVVSPPLAFRTVWRTKSSSPPRRVDLTKRPPPNTELVRQCWAFAPPMSTPLTIAILRQRCIGQEVYSTNHAGTTIVELMARSANSTLLFSLSLQYGNVATAPPEAVSAARTPNAVRQVGAF